MSMFCPECGSFLIPKKNTERRKAAKKPAAKAKKGAKKKKEAEEKAPKEEVPKKILVCSSCGYTSGNEKIEVVLTETVEQPEEIVAVVDKEVSTMPLIDATCEKCSHSKAHFWTVQTRSADEPETKFMRCEKCKHTWREYD